MNPNNLHPQPHVELSHESPLSLGLLPDVFPTLLGVMSSVSGGRHGQEVTEAIRVASYHLWRAREALGACNLATAQPEVATIVLGDLAIREAVTSLETSLLVVNVATKIGVGVKDLGWSSSHPRLRRALSSAPVAELRSLVLALDRVFLDERYVGLKNYRDWVTHRGAPEIIRRTFKRLEGDLPMDDLFSKLKGVAGEEELRVRCWPFGPAILGRTVGIQEGKIVLDKVLIADSTKGKLQDDVWPDDWVDRNMVERILWDEKGRDVINDQVLAVYTLEEFTRAAHAVEEHATRALSREVDQAVAAACLAMGAAQNT